MPTIIVELSGEEHRLLRSLQKVIAQQDKTTKAVKDTASASKTAATAAENAGKKSEDAGAKAVDSFANKGKGAVLSYAASFVGVQQAISKVLDGLEEIDARHEAAAARARANRFTRGELAQLATTPDELANLNRMSDKAKGILGTDDNEAAKMVFEMVQSGQEKYFDSLMNLKKIEADPVSVSRSMTALEAAFGKEELGDFNSVLSKALVASAYTPATVSEVLASTAKVGGMAKMAGYSDEETLAAVTVASKPLGTADRGATAIGHLAKQLSLDKEGRFENMPLLDAVEKVERMQLSMGELQRLLKGRVEAVRAYTAIVQNKDLYKTVLGELGEANGKDMLSERLALQKTDPRIQAVDAFDSARISAEADDQKYGDLKNVADAVAQANRVRVRTENQKQYGVRGGELVEQILAMPMAKAARLYTGDEDYLRAAVFNTYVGKFQPGLLNNTAPRIGNLQQFEAAKQTLAQIDTHRKNIGAEGGPSVEELVRNYPKLKTPFDQLAPDARFKAIEDSLRLTLSKGASAIAPPVAKPKAALPGASTIGARKNAASVSLEGDAAKMWADDEFFKMEGADDFQTVIDDTADADLWGSSKSARSSPTRPTSSGPSTLERAALKLMEAVERLEKAGAKTAPAPVGNQTSSLRAGALAETTAQRETS